MKQKEPLRGRCISVQNDSIVIRNRKGTTRVDAREPELKTIRPGDIIEWSPEREADPFQVLTPNRADGRTTWMDHVLDERRVHATETRLRVERGIREFFAARGFVETRTPLLVPSPGMEPHIRPVEARGTGDSSGRHAYLPTSPEFAMKRLLAGGLERIFQICPAFRDEPVSTTHFPEFTMLEWYRAYAGYEEIMTDTEELVSSIAITLFGKPVLAFQGREISVAPPWPRLRVRDLFLKIAGVDLVRSSTVETLRPHCSRLGLGFSESDTWDDLYFRIWLNVIEPRLPGDRAVLVTRYPASQSALAVVDTDPDGSRWAKRFEVYAGGLELGNAFEELTDPKEQRRRFIEDMELRDRAYGPGFPKSPIDEGFLGALEEGMPPSGGIAVGVDRLVMLFADEPDIEKTFWLPPFWSEAH